MLHMPTPSRAQALADQFQARDCRVAPPFVEGARVLVSEDARRHERYMSTADFQPAQHNEDENRAVRYVVYDMRRAAN